MGVGIRRAASGDVDWLLGQLRQFSSFYGTTRSLFGTEDSARSRVQDMVDDHVVFLYERDGIRTGLIAGYLVPHPFNPEITMLAEAFWWVDPAHRGTSAGLKLFDAFTEYGKTNADWITMSLTDKSPVKPETLTRRGYRARETGFLLEVA